MPKVKRHTKNDPFSEGSFSGFHVLSLCFLAGATTDLGWGALELGCGEALGKSSLSRSLQETPHTSISLRGTKGVTPYRVPPRGRFPVEETWTGDQSLAPLLCFSCAYMYMCVSQRARKKSKRPRNTFCRNMCADTCHIPTSSVQLPAMGTRVLLVGARSH